MAVQASQNIPSLFKELIWLEKNGDYEKALKVVNKLSTELPEDEKVFQCKIVCFINLGKYEEALAAVKKNQKFLKHVLFEKAFCEYRLNRNDEAMKTMNSGDLENDLRLKELYAQLTYRMENYELSYNTYRELMRKSEDDLDVERETNLAAVVAALQLWEGKQCEGELALREVTHELCYNAACRLIGMQKYEEALEKLKMAEEICKARNGDDAEVNQEEIDSELAIIWVQMGYALQKLNRNEEALKLYNQVIKLKSNDVLLMAVASNNIVTINKEQNVFDSKKRIKAATSGDLKNRLTTQQKKSIAVNECLLHMYAGQAEQCHKCAQALQKIPSSSINGSLIEVAQMIREKSSEKAIEFLQGQIEKLQPEGELDVVQLKLALAQIFLNQGHVYKACEVIRSLGEEECYKPGVVSTLVSLYLCEEDRDSAAEVLNQAVQWHLDNKKSSEDLVTLLRANANFHLNGGKPQVASQMLEELRKLNPKDLKLLAQLILAYSKYDAKKAQEVSKQFPPPEKLPAEVDIDQLESSASWAGSKWTKKTAKSEASPMSPKDKNATPAAAAGVIAVKKKHKKKKKILPKNYDPKVTPDPERWLPLRERSNYRGKKKNKRRDVGKGTQGAVSVGVSDLDASEHPPVNGEVGSPHTSPPSASNASAPRQQKPPAALAKQKPKKKKGGRGW